MALLRQKKVLAAILSEAMLFFERSEAQNSP
jgi:hypothetical protein